jgi:5'-methylthioadenosine phosphorylase
MSVIGVIGGSGFYKLLENAENKNFETAYGWPSSPITMGELEGKQVAFIARHGLTHNIPPHKVNYKANIQALYDLGCRQILASTAVGSLKKHIKPGDFVVPDQYFNNTQSRDDTFYHGPEVVHISSAEPYCPKLRQLIVNIADESKIRVHPVGTIVVINGPRFSTVGESRDYQSRGFDIIGMTQYPEAALAREREMCYASIACVTDYDSGFKDDTSIKPVTAEEVARTFDANAARVRQLIKEIIRHVPVDRDCLCAHALEGAKLSK